MPLIIQSLKPGHLVCMVLVVRYVEPQSDDSVEAKYRQIAGAFLPVYLAKNLTQ